MSGSIYSLKQWAKNKVDLGLQDRIVSIELIPKKTFDVIRNNMNHPSVKKILLERVNEADFESVGKSYRTAFSKMEKQLTVWEKDPRFYELQVLYKSARSRKGRVFPLSSVGLCSMKRELRQTLCYQHYIDVDMANAHPTILLQFLEKNCGNFVTKPKCLRYYIRNRDEILSRVMNVNKLDRDTAKTVFLIPMNNGSDLPISEDNLKKEENKFIRQFSREMGKILTELYGLTEKGQVYETYRTNKFNNPMGSTLNILLVTQENIILRSAVSWALSKKLDADVLCFDGFQIRKKYNESYVDGFEPLELSDSDLESLSKFVLKDTGYDMKFTVKEMHPYINIDKLGITRTPFPSALELCKTFYTEFGNLLRVFTSKEGWVFMESSKTWKMIGFEESGLFILDKLENFYKPQVPSTDDWDVFESKFQDGILYLKIGKMYFNNIDFRDPTTEFESDPYLIPLGVNCLNIVTHEFRPIEAEDEFTFTIKTPYNPRLDTAPVEEFFARYFQTPSSDESTPEFDVETFNSFKKALGISITGVHLKRLFVLIGESGSGKSTVTDIMKKVCHGGLCGSLNESLFVKSRSFSDKQINTDIQSLKSGIRFGFTDELGADVRLNDNLVKKLTGGNEIRYRPIRSAEESLTCFTKFWISTNNFPEFDVSDTGLQSRLCFFEFKNNFSGSKGDVDSWIESNKSRILTWLIEQAREAALSNFDVPVTQAMLNFKKDLYVSSSGLEGFISKFKEDSSSPGIPSNEMYELYKRFDPSCELSEKSFYQKLHLLLPNKVRVNRMVNGKRVTVVYKYIYSNVD